jgi:hypothetical protein
VLKGFYEFHGSHDGRLQAEGFFETLLRLLNVGAPLFVVSFCRHDQGDKEFTWASGGFAIEDEVYHVEHGK